jgi:iron complex transport system ATP-binding protein
MTDGTAVALTGVGHCYRPGAWVFRNYDAAIPKGRTFALLGPNGCGKTTLLKILLGVLTPAEGTVAVHGRVAFVPQLFQVSFDYSALDMVLMGRARKVGLFAQPSAADERAALEALDRFHLADLAARSFHELSGGQRQMVIFARALVAEAEILILDEPASALDLKNQALILDCIASLSHEDGLTVVLTTHHPHHVLAVADQALLMLDDGHYACGPVAEVLTEANLQALYGVPMKRLAFTHDGDAVVTFAPVFLPSSSKTRCHAD